MVIVAPTGIAALNVQGATIHSVFKLPHKCLTPGDVHFGEKQRKLLKAIDVLVIDEISMVRADVLDAIHVSLSLAHGNDAPFGGVQVVFFGDLFQLPPVVERGLNQYFTEVYGGCYFFNAKVMQYVDIQVYSLTEVYRQTDPIFIRLLNALREKRLNQEGINWLNTRCIRPSHPEENAVVLCTTNISAQRLNQTMLDAINATAYCYKADVHGEFSSGSYPTDEALVLKVGARVMMLKNDTDRRYVNGSIGEVVKLTDKQVMVQVNGEKCIIQPEKWEAMSYNYRSKEQKLEEERLGEFRQLPLKLAWAITIHKSQGLSFDAVRVDLGSGAFACGQVYVAFSRCRSIQGLSLARKLSLSDIQVDPLVAEYDALIQTQQRTQLSTKTSPDLDA